MSFSRFKCYLFSLLLLGAGSVHSSSVLEVLTEDWAPFNYEQDGRVTGYSSEVVKAVLNAADIPFQIRLGVWKGVYERALSEPNVLIYTISRTTEREDKFHWIGPIASRQQALYKLKSRKDIHVNKLEDAKNYRIVIQEKDAIAEFFGRNGFTTDNPNYNLYAKQILSLKMLFADRVDMVPSHPLTMKYELAAQGYNDDSVEKVIDLEVQGAYYMAFSKASDADLVSRTREAFNRLLRAGTIESIRSRFSVD